MTWILEPSVTTTHLVDDVMRCQTFNFVFHVELYACSLQGFPFVEFVRHIPSVMFGGCTLPDPTASSMVRNRSDMDMSGEDRGHQPHQRVLYREGPVHSQGSSTQAHVQKPVTMECPPQVPLIFSQPRCKITNRMRCSRPWIGKLMAHSQIINNNIK
jgi:hypothetical protein